MPLTKDQIKTAALELNPAEREALAEELLMSISATEGESVDSAWLQEVKRRDSLFRQQKTIAKPVDEVIARLKGNSQP